MSVFELRSNCSASSRDAAAGAPEGEASGMAWKFPPHIVAAFGFALQMAVGAILFSLIAAFAVGLSALVQALERAHLVPEWLKAYLHLMEFLVFAVDALLYGLFVIVEFIRTGRSLLGLMRETHG